MGTENAVVKGWLINSMDPKLTSNYTIFPNAKAVWDTIATTYFDGTDASQVYDLKRKVTRLQQGGDLSKHITTIFKAYGGKLIFVAQIQ
ncbi:hypothetical protein CK203_053106 [Vitis vinifera]|uniref:Retrotransposon gag domain-containing protein n=1 Tax=Vitis vinifera TaxID=29760 RepID=A0A438GLB3_VITVI|nr:hypothetical protein CK203_053106 [Vitis vinifera]